MADLHFHTKTMDFEFDNEIHALLQNTARDSVRSRENSAHNHLDADDLAAFAENVLPNNTRLLYASHLAECDNCREILSNIILLQDAEQEETILVESLNEIPVSTESSWNDWFKNLLVLPKLGYAVAGLAFLLIGTYAFVIYRETQSSKEETVAVIQSIESEKQAAKQRITTSAPVIKEESRPEIVGEPSPSPVESDLATATQAESTPSENSESLPPGYRITKNPNTGNKPVQQEQQVARNEAKDQSSASNLRTVSAPPASGAPGVAAPLPERATDVASSNNIGDKAKAELQADQAASKQAAEEREINEKSDIKESVTNSTQASRSTTASTQVLRAPQKAEPALATTVVGGKTFRRQNNVWVDSTYNSQTVTTVSRNSSEYQKLDAGLRSIANSLNGEVIVVWQGKAYKIR